MDKVKSTTRNKHVETINVIALCRPHGCVYAPLQARRYAKGFWYHRWISGRPRYFGFHQCFSNVDWGHSQEKTATASWPTILFCSSDTILFMFMTLRPIYVYAAHTAYSDTGAQMKRIRKGKSACIYKCMYINIVAISSYPSDMYVTMATDMDVWITFNEASRSHGQLRSTCAIWPTFGDWHSPGKSVERDWGLSRVPTQSKRFLSYTRQKKRGISTSIPMCHFRNFMCLDIDAPCTQIGLGLSFPAIHSLDQWCTDDKLT